jgi:hypothetical protein
MDLAILQQKYNDIVDNKNKEFQLKTYVDQVNLEIDNIKKLNKLYQTEKKEAILKTILENYTGIIQPLLNDIRELKYNFFTIEVDEKHNVNYFIAEPYTISQLEISTQSPQMTANKKTTSKPKLPNETRDDSPSPYQGPYQDRTPPPYEGRTPPNEGRSPSPYEGAYEGVYEGPY